MSLAIRKAKTWPVESSSISRLMPISRKENVRDWSLVPSIEAPLVHHIPVSPICDNRKIIF